MFIMCDNCKSKLPVIVTSLNIIPMDNQINSNIHSGKFGELNINPPVNYKIKAHPTIYRCRECGYEKQYPSNEINFE